MAEPEPQSATQRKPEVSPVYPTPKDRPVNERLISEVSKGQKPSEKK
jgi:hypothetical protein